MKLMFWRPFKGPCAEGAPPRMKDGVFQKKTGAIGQHPVLNGLVLIAKPLN
jgi:hypothetical protein